MNQPPPSEAGANPGDPLAPPDENVALPDELIYAVEQALEEDDRERFLGFVEGLHVADLADLLEYLTRDQRAKAVETLQPELDPEILTYLDAGIREEVIEQIGPRGLARALSALESDDAVDVFEDLDEAFQKQILAALPRGYRAIIEESLSYPEDSAGRLMQREMVVVPSAWTVGDAIDFMRKNKELPKDFYDLFIVDPKHKPIGAIPLSRVLRNKRPVRLTKIMDDEVHTIPITMDQEDVAYQFRQYGLVSAPVLDEAGRLVGVITVDDVVHVIDEEAEEDLMKMGGVTETDLYSAVLDTTKARFSWLTVNLLTAVVASLVIGLFEGTIQQLVALAVLMPIVASMGGNAGTQTLTVAVRAIAMKDLTAANAARFVGKEVLVGSANGILFALMTGAVAWLWFGVPELGLLMAAAMVVNMLVAGLSGTLIPIGLERLGVDPAIASTVFLTTVTDVVGFFTFLGLAALFLL